MFQVSVEEEFAAGHALRGYKGKCENPHGHNYKVRVTLEGANLDEIGLLYDFSDLKKALHQTVGTLDHQFMNDVAPFKDANPSAENIAKFFYEQISAFLSEHAHKSGNGAHESSFCRVRKVKVWETSTSTATYFAAGR
jgi:6-pyruvoyltetrahydropterin/6-carboxytetrahydropterin synthase